MVADTLVPVPSHQGGIETTGPCHPLCTVPLTDSDDVGFHV